jgi:squalene synthase HpnC
MPSMTTRVARAEPRALFITRNLEGGFRVCSAEWPVLGFRRVNPARTGADAGTGFAACAALARDHYENFPVRAPFLPGDVRDDLAAVYAFCRATDDLGDELPGDRLAALNAWEAAVRSALAGNAASDPFLAALAATAQRRAIPAELFHRVIEANRRDQTVTRHADDQALLTYCSYSATPVGRMVLRVLGLGDPELDALSDATCIGLQLANFWQDLARDWAQGRCYLPLDACRRYGVVPEVELPQPHASAALRALVADRVGDARAWLERGWPLADRLAMRWRPLVRGFSRGGWEILDRIEAQEFDTLASRPEVPAARRRAILARELARAPRRGVAITG